MVWPGFRDPHPKTIDLKAGFIIFIYPNFMHKFSRGNPSKLPATFFPQNPGIFSCLLLGGGRTKSDDKSSVYDDLKGKHEHLKPWWNSRAPNHLRRKKNLWNQVSTLHWEQNFMRNRGLFKVEKIQVLPANRLLELSSIDSPFTWMSQEVSKWLVSGL